MRYSKFDENGDPTIIPYDTIALDSNKSLIGTAILEISIRDQSNNTYWDGAAFVSGETFLAMTKIGDAIALGRYRYLFDTTGIPPGTFSITIIDTSVGQLAKNVPQFAEDILADGIARQIELGAAGAVGDAVYDPNTSVMTLFSWHDPAQIVGVFDMKDKLGDPAGETSFFKKLIQ